MAKAAAPGAPASVWTLDQSGLASRQQAGDSKSRGLATGDRVDCAIWQSIPRCTVPLFGRNDDVDVSVSPFAVVLVRALGEKVENQI